MKKLFAGFLVIAFSVFFWYMFGKEYDYQFRTSVRGTPGIVFSEISEWKQFASANSYDDIELVNRRPYKTITQRVAIDGSEYIELKWELEEGDDSSTALKVNVKSTRNHIENRWAIVNPFTRSIFLDTMQKKLQAFHQKLRNQASFFNIRIENEVVNSPEMECACVTSTNVHITQKAEAMVKTIELLENYVVDRNLELKGYPFVKVRVWEREEDLITFDFCFPINDIKELDEQWPVFFKKTPARPSLKAVFTGNYRLSHIGWFEMLYQAEQKGITVEGLPLEIFHNNPKTELDPLNWTAEIFLPVH